MFIGSVVPNFKIFYELSPDIRKEGKICFCPFCHGLRFFDRIDAHADNLHVPAVKLRLLLMQFHELRTAIGSPHATIHHNERKAVFMYHLSEIDGVASRRGECYFLQGFEHIFAIVITIRLTRKRRRQNQRNAPNQQNQPGSFHAFKPNFLEIQIFFQYHKCNKRRTQIGCKLCLTNTLRASQLSSI